MHKLAIAAAVTATVGGVGALVFTATRTDAHAGPHAAGATGVTRARAGAPSEAARPRGHANHAALFDLMAATPRHAPSLPAAGASGTAPKLGDSNDCAAVGRYMAELEGDATNGPTDRPDEETRSSCAEHYAWACEHQGWSADRRNCVLAAGDLINAHLCAGGVGITNPAAPNAIPANLSCAVLGPHIATVAQAAGFHTDVTDLPAQITAACDAGEWSVELRKCFDAASTMDTLQTCINPAE